jgi:hypothetical protein
LPDLVTVGTAEGITLVNADCAESTSIPRGDRLAPGLKRESKGAAVVKDSIKRIASIYLQRVLGATPSG